VSALNTVTADYNRQQRREARDAAKALELEKVEDDLGPMFAEVSARLAGCVCAFECWKSHDAPCVTTVLVQVTIELRHKPKLTSLSLSLSLEFLLHSTTRANNKAEGDYVHETVVACDTLGSPRGRGATSGPGFTGEGFGTRKWRAAELGKQGLPPYKLAPSLTRMEDFRLQGGERSGFGVPAYFSDKSKELVDPYDIQVQK
jgi:hypothetical protein